MHSQTLSRLSVSVLFKSYPLFRAHNSCQTYILEMLKHLWQQRANKIVNKWQKNSVPCSSEEQSYQPYSEEQSDH